MDTEYEFGVAIPGRILPESEWTKTGIKRFPDRGPLDWPSIFGRTAPVVLELGCGNARWTLGSALARLEIDHFATDILPVVIRYATRRGNQRGLNNARFAVRDALSFLKDYCLPGSVAEIHLYHPQPYQEPHSAHLRLVTPLFLSLLHRTLVPGGLFVVQTDHPDYWKYIADISSVYFDFRTQHELWPDAPAGRTRREILARSRGLDVYRGMGTARSGLHLPDALRDAKNVLMPTFRIRGPWAELDEIERRDKC